MSGPSSTYRERCTALTPLGEATVALIRLRDGLAELGDFDRQALAEVLCELADLYAPRSPHPVA